MVYIHKHKVRYGVQPNNFAVIKSVSIIMKNFHCSIYTQAQRRYSVQPNNFTVIKGVNIKSFHCSIYTQAQSKVGCAAK